MMRQIVSLICVLTVLYTTCCNAQPVLTLSQNNVWEYKSSVIRCYFNEDKNNYNTSRISLWKSDNPDVLFEVTKPCNSLELNSTKDSTNGRLTYASSSITFTNLTLQDTGFYVCTLVSCSSPDQTMYSNNATLTVHKPNSEPVLYVADNETSVYENTLVTLSLTCSGYVGYPPGIMSLILVNNTNSQVYVKYNMSHDAAGNAAETVNFTYAYQVRNIINYFYCESIKSNTNDWITLSSPIYTVPVDYDPQYIGFSYSEDSLPRSGNVTRTFYLEKPRLYTILCYTYSRPLPKFNFTQAEGPTSFVQVKDDDEIYVKVGDVSVQQRLVLNCATYYKSNSTPVQESQLEQAVEIIIVPNVTPNTTPSAAGLSSASYFLVTTLVTLVLTC